MEFDDREPEAVDPDEFDPSCGDSRVVSGRLTLTEVSVQNDSDESAFGDAIAEQLLAEYGEDMLTGFDAEGFDVHRAPNGDVFVFYAAC